MNQLHLISNNFDDDDLTDEDEFLTDLAGECYIGFQKLLRTEMRIFDRRDSFIMKTSMSLSRRQGSFIDNARNSEYGSSFNARLAQTKNPPGRMESNDFTGVQSMARHQIKKFTEKITVAGKYIGEITG